MSKILPLKPLNGLTRQLEVDDIRFNANQNIIQANLTEQVKVGEDWFKKETKVISFGVANSGPGPGRSESDVISNSEVTTLLAQIEESILALIKKTVDV